MVLHARFDQLKGVSAEKKQERAPKRCHIRKELTHTAQDETGTEE